MNVPETTLTAIRGTNQVFAIEVVQKRDFGALYRVYTADARVLPPGAPMMTGRDQILSFWREAISSMGLRAAMLETVDAEAVGESVIEVGRADLTVGSGQIVQVKYVVHWK